MIKLKRKDINDFLQLSGNIKSNSILPINQSIKLEGGCLTKCDTSSTATNKTFITHAIDVDKSASVLLSENILSIFSKASLDEFINVDIKETKGKKKIWLSDSRDKIDFEWIDPKYFTKFPDKEKENEVLLESDVLVAIGIAAQNVLVDPNKNGQSPANFDFVHLAENYVYASDQNCVYAKRFDNLPTVSIDAECAKTICVFPYVNFYQKGNYNFFEHDKTLYAFLQPASIKPPAIPAALPKEINGSYMEISAKDFIGFCDMVIKMIPMRPNKDIVYASFIGNELVCEDSDYNINIQRELQFSGEFKPHINFIPRRFSDFMRSLGASTIKICKSHLNPAAITVWDNDDADMCGMVAGVSIN